MANKKEMMVLGAAAAGAASYYLYGKMKPMDEAGKNSGNPALSESKMRERTVAPEIKKEKPSSEPLSESKMREPPVSPEIKKDKPTSEPKPKASAVKESDLKKLDDKNVKAALDAIKSPDVKRETAGRKAEKESQKENSV